MSEVFASAYAGSYDLLYEDKNYGSECDLIERIIRQHGLNPTRTIVDLGCGTGSHALPLARRGYEVVGIDRSREMLTRAQEKAIQQKQSNATFHAGDIRSANLDRTFDAALMMFAVLGYQLENRAVIDALKTARRHMSPGGILIFDVWYGPAVLHMRPSERMKVIPTAEGRILRFASGSLDIRRQTCTVDYQLWRIKEDRVLAHLEESHEMRYFFPLEIQLFLETTGFAMVRTGAFPEFDREADENTWNVLVAARAV
jgi:SAM-dependent methyltransferase